MFDKKTKMVNVIIFLLSCTAAFVAMAPLMAAAMLDPAGDGFADKLAIPRNIEIAEPLNELRAVPGEADDSFQNALLSALTSPGDNDATIIASVATLTALGQNAPETLGRYLAVNPSWRVFKERGNVFATRRWRMGSEWRYKAHGHYTESDVWPRTDIPNFQFRLTIGLSGKSWWRGDGDTTRLKTGDTSKVSLSEGNQMHQSHCVITAGPLVLEVFEQSDAMERRMTKTALTHIEKELMSLAAKPTWETIRSGLPPNSMRQGDSSFDLWNAFQPGIYDSIIWVNPGEPGMIYLKAFEVTKGTPLSADRLKDKSNERIGWSDNPAELFFSNAHFTIYEGDWGKPYAARFEVWFTPDSGKPDRKLMEKVFKIEGWQR